MPSWKTSGFFSFLASLFNNSGRKHHLSQTRKAIVLNELIQSSTPNADYFIMVILSCTIATFGLITNSAAVIIGAMLVAPLMSPIMRLSMASISGMSRLFRQSLVAILEGFGLAVALSSLLAFLTYRLPLGALATISDEVLSRTSPSLIDLLIALAGGAAAAYALVHPKLSAALPGVAIATALMPPICTMGIGIALWQPAIFLGALLLFVTNLTAISFSGMATFALMGFGPRHKVDEEIISQSVSISLILVVAISILLGVFAINTLKEAHTFNLASTAIIESASVYTDVLLVELNVSSEGDLRKINAVVRTARELSLTEVEAVQSDIADRLQKPVALQLVTIPMQLLDPLNPPTPTATITPTAYLTATATNTPTQTPVATQTPIPSATPAPAFVLSSRGVDVFDTPSGTVQFSLPRYASLRVFLESLQTIDKMRWVEIQDTFGRSGWVNAALLDIANEP